MEETDTLLQDFHHAHVQSVSQQKDVDKKGRNLLSTVSGFPLQGQHGTAERETLGKCVLVAKWNKSDCMGRTSIPVPHQTFLLWF